MECRFCGSNTHEITTQGVNQLNLFQCIAINLADLVKGSN